MAATLLRPIADSALSDDGGAAASLLQDEDDDGFLAADQQEQQDKEPRPPPPTPLQTFELAGVIFAAHVSPLPLLAPYTCASLSGPAYFLPLLLLAGTMSWLSSALVTSLQARYVGANSHAELIAAVLPHRLSKVGQTLASLFVLGGSLARTTLGIVASAEIAVDLVRPRVPRDQGGLSDDARWDRSVAVGLIGAVWLLFPFLWDPILAVLGFRRPPSTGPKTTIPYTRLGTRSQADLDLDLDLDSPSVSSPVTPPPPFEREHAEWDWNESHYRPEGGGGGGGGEPPSGRPRPPPRWSALLNLPAWSVAVLVWPIALALLGLRLRHLNRRYTDRDSLPFAPASSSSSSSSWNSYSSEGGVLGETTTAWWKAILLTFTMMMGASHETFHYLTALKPRPPTSTCSSSSERPFALKTTRRGRAFASSSSSSFAAAAAAEEGGGGGGGGVLDRLQGGGEGALSSGRRRRRRNQFSLAMALGLGGAFLVHLGWALVGTVGFAAAAASPREEEGHPTPDLITFPSPVSERLALPLLPTTTFPTGNILSDPRLLLGTGTGDSSLLLLTAVRLLVLFATLTQLEGHARVGLASVRRFFRLLLLLLHLRALSCAGRPPPPLAARPRDLSSSSSDSEADPDSRSPPTSRRNGMDGGAGGGGGAILSRVLARTGFYALAVLCAWATIALLSPGRDRERDGTGLVRLAEWSGIGIAGIGGCLVPAFTYLILFHLRKPRLILLSADPDPNGPETGSERERDELLERKEREMQRRLSGRRIWTDLGVFGVLGPVGVVLVARGLWAMIQ
ncbi:hypothetical protein C6P46_001288 [Rhodotorula mucilaginosa]|uniref:Uncharacterized protein n=1 Tax=Rhodotorula mucilaginosa TaxID=5537 RepID=A0A9P6VVD1_RHOMI|nr:hypothetical protein C6P46_001288 [Rhodotorula mucilaginosa]